MTPLAEGAAHAHDQGMQTILAMVLVSMMSVGCAIVGDDEPSVQCGEAWGASPVAPRPGTYEISAYDSKEYAIASLRIQFGHIIIERTDGSTAATRVQDVGNSCVEALDRSAMACSTGVGTVSGAVFSIQGATVCGAWRSN